MVAAISKPEASGGGYFPLDFYLDFLKLLRAHDSLVRIVTYRDLSWNDDFAYKECYPRERASWLHELSSGAMDPKKIYVLIQHDVDSNPESTMELLRAEEQLGIQSNVMIFNRRINRRHLAGTGELLYTEYPIDYGYLRHLQDNCGFVIGYHSNAMEQALYNVEKAKAIFEADIEQLRKQFRIEFFSAHGGATGPNGLNNHHLIMPETLSSLLRWVHNRYTPWFTSTFTDGGINSPRRDPSSRDLRDHIKTWKIGQRYRILTHPQYYTRHFRKSPRLAGTPWYEELLETYSTSQREQAWGSVNQWLTQQRDNPPHRIERAKMLFGWYLDRLGKRVGRRP